MDDWNNLRRLFPITDRYAYLNHAAVGPLPTPSAEAMQRHIAQRQGLGEADHEEWDQRVQNVRSLAACLIGATLEEIAFVSSTSHALNIVAAGLDWQPGDNVVCAEGEFPANVYPWVNLRRRGVDVRFAQEVDGRIPLESIASVVDGPTRLVAISFVEFFSGYRNDLAQIGEICRQHGALLCVDAIQGLGALALDVRACGIDFLAAHAAKWLLGPIGIGFLYCRAERLPEIDLVMGGWRGVADQGNYFRYDAAWYADARRFEVGSLNHLGIAGMGGSLQLLLDVGIERIEARIRQLTDYLLAGLLDLGFMVITPHERPSERSGIISFVPDNRDPQALAAQLLEAGVAVSARGPCIRVSPHCYNTETEIDRLLDVLAR
jgi:cysteine desulfurase/selenocysteine lyase